MVKSPKELRDSYKKRLQNLPYVSRDKPRAPRTQKLRTATQFDKNKLKKPSTMAKYRYGYNNVFKVKKARERMLKLGFKPPGSYGNNQQKGVMPAMPYEIPKAFCDEDAGWILRECAKSTNPHYTRGQLDAVRAMLSFFYQLQTGKHYDGSREPCNYASVKDQWGCQGPNDYAPNIKSTKSVVSVEPAGLATAFTTEWSLQSGWAFMKWCVTALITWDWSVNGNRCRVDLEKIKQSEDHIFRPSEGWMSSDMPGGRSKLMNRKEMRPWKNYRVCLCPKGVHIPLPEGWNAVGNLDNQSNPINITWPTTCPLNCFQVVRDSLEETDQRTYPKWIEKQNRFAAVNVSHPDMLKQTKEWLTIQGANPDNLTFDNNSGRKSLGKWCDQFNVPYVESVHIHGDLYCTWKQHYQYGLKREHVEGSRDQSKDPAVCTAALRRFARGIGRGREVRDDPKHVDISQLGQLMAAALRAMGKGDQVARILDKHEDKKTYGD